MSIENVKKLKLIMDKLQQSLIIEDDDVGDKMFDEAYGAMSELATKQDIETLPGFMDMFILDDMEYTGVCETLINDIFNNFTVEQIIPVLYKKLNQLVELNMDRAVYMVGCCFDDIQELKKLVETLPPQKADELLERLENWYNEPFSNEVTILRKDMKAWPKK